MPNPKPPKKRPRPTQAEMEQWISDGYAESEDGCFLDIDANVCIHGRQNLLKLAGVI